MQDYEEAECPTCGVMVPKAQIENFGQCERHIIEEYNEREDGDEVEHGISIIENKWKPKVIQEKGRGAVQ